MRGGQTVKMNGARSEFPVSPSPRLPAEHVLDSGAVVFPGVFDQHGCPLVVFPAESQCKLSEELSAEEVSHFIYYCLRLHNIRVEESLVSVVVDLRQATFAIARFIAETLLFLEVHRQTLHSVYIVQPKKKDVLKQLGKLLTPTGSKQHRPVLFRRIFLKEVFELCNYIDRSQLMSSLGGYLIYCHQSWVAFIKEIDAFVQEFLLVVNRLPSCISTLQSLSKLAVPTDFERLREFCSMNEARFQQLRRDLGLDELLRRGERLLEKLRFPENDQCFHAMAGTLLYTHTALEMLRNYNRITAAVEKVEMLRKQAFSRAHVQLQMASLQRDAQKVEEQMEELMRTKVQPYRTEEAGDAHRADELRLDFQTSVYTPAMALVRRADDIIHTLAEGVPLSERKPAERWLDGLDWLKESLCSSVQRLSRSLRAVSDFHHACNRCERWYGLVLGESLLQELLWSGHCEGLGESGCCSSWRRGVESFLRRNPCPEVEELVKLAHLANAITDPQLQRTGTQLSHRCMTLRRILTSPGAIPLRDLQLALQWQYEYLKGNRTTSEEQRDACSPPPDSARPTHASSQCESLSDLSKWPSVGDCHHPLSSAGAVGKPPSLSSFDSGFDGAGSCHLDLRSRREPPRLLGSKPLHGQIHEENIESVSDSENQCEELGFGLVRDAARASIQIIPKITSDSLNLEIKVKRSATLPKNPWLSLPIDDLESSYTVTITPNSSHPRRSPGPSKHSERPRDLPAQTDAQESFEEPDLSPVGNVLSSTLTDHEDKPSRTADGDQSLLWDTFDLHNLRLDESLGDWAQREQRELSAVEETLGRAAEIIQEEENVLAQEVVLDELLRSEDLNKHWPVWTEGQQRGVMSATDLAESGVIGFDDPLQNELVSLSSDNLNASEVCESDSDVSGLSSKRPLRRDTRCPEADGSGIIRELRDLQVLEEQIMEECLKLEELRRTETEVLQSEDHVTTRNSSCERRRFLAQLQEEKWEVEKMERSLSREMERAGKARKRSSKGRRVVKCSVMERSSKLRDLDEELWRNCRAQSPDEAQHTDTESETAREADSEERSSPNEPLEEVYLTDSSLSSEPLSSSRPDPTMGLSESGIGCADSPPHSEALQDRTAHGEPLSALSERPEDMGSTAVPLHQSCTNIPDLIHPEITLQRPVEHSDDETSPCNCTDGGGCAAGPVEPKVGESSDVRGAFDPGGVSAFPLDGQRRPRSDSEHTGTQAQGASGTSVTTSELDASAQSRSQGLHMQNNNNNNTAVVLRTQETQEMPCHRDLSSTGQCRADGGSTRAPCRPTHNQLQIHTRQMSDYKTPIVLDTGSGLMKAGFADQDLPTAVFPTVIGRPKYEEVMNGSVDRDVFIGHDAQHMRGVLTLTYPIRNGVVRSWDEMEMIWRHAFQQLSVAPEDHPVLLTEAALNPLQNRQRMVELMFEAFNVPLTFVAVQAVLALYASGRTTGVVLDSGDGVSHSVPVFEGYCLPHAIQRFNLAGADVTLQLQKLLLEQGVCMRTSAELEIVREMKERCCFVALNYEAELKSAGSEVHYTLPDGRLVSLATERFRAPEILFRPELIGRDHYGMHESVFRSILQSDIDLRRSFVGNVLLSGGNTLLAGLPERLQQEIRRMVPADLSACVRVTSPQERDFSVWSGGAALANLPDLHSAWISADEYEEFGPQIVFRKCF